MIHEFNDNGYVYTERELHSGKYYKIIMKKAYDISSYHNKNADEMYFSYSLIYTIIIEDLNEALKVNLNLADILFTTFLKIKKITKILN